MKAIIKTRKDVIEFLNYESKNYNLNNAHCPLFSFKENKILYKCNYLLRHLEYYTNCNKKILKMIFKVLYVKYQRKFFMNIPINVFDKGLKFIHIGSRLVNHNATVGKNCTMHINTSIVAGGSNNSVPKIGNNVILGVGSTILGNAIVGDNTAVGAGAVVNKNFTLGNMTIAGVPAKKISNNTEKSWNSKEIG